MTTIASDAMAVCWPEAVPRDYEDMQTKYGGFVTHLLKRYNKVGRNYRDLHGHIWMRLLEADVIGKYIALISDQMPKTVTALAACEFLGINFNQWRTAMWAFHKGDPIKKAGVVVGRRTGHWMPTPINIEAFKAKGQLGYSAKTALFDFDDVLKLSSDEKELKNGNVRGPFAKQDPLQLEGPRATKSHFQSYLARAIHNNFANWCRGLHRKHKERPADTFFEFRPKVEDQAFDWEANLKDPVIAHQETVAALQDARTKIHTSLFDGMRDVPSCKPVEEHEVEMFELLEEGYTLAEAVKKLDIPKNVQKAVLRSVGLTPSA